MSGPYTYNSGPYLKATKPITKGDIVQLCKILNKFYENAGIEFEPEPITEGGIVYKFKNNDILKKAYKTIRMYFRNPCIKWCKQFITYNSIDSLGVSKTHLKKLGLLELYNSHKTVGEWPSIPLNVMELWENNNEVILEAGLSIHTYLKAFNGAPLFTEDELKTFIDCVEIIGFKLDSKIPKNKELVSFGTLGETIVL